MVDSTVARIGPYRVVRRLGVGGMGEVFLAYDIRDAVDAQGGNVTRAAERLGLHPNHHRLITSLGLR